MQVHMNLNVRSFCNYVEHFYYRLARDLNKPIDFHFLASKNAKRPTKFRDHVVALMVELQEGGENVDPPCEVQETKLVDRVVPFVACCVASQLPKRDEALGMCREILSLVPQSSSEDADCGS